MKGCNMTKKVYTINEIKKILNKSLKNTKVNKAILFGSYAKGEADENSDIDLLVGSNGLIKGLEFFGVLQTLVEALNKNVDFIEKKGIISGGYIEQEIEKTGVLVYEI